MPRQFEILMGGAEQRQPESKPVSEQTKARHLRNVTASVAQDALDAWGDIWDQFQDSVTHGCLVMPEAERGFKPQCGWPEFLEKMWLLKHHLDYIKRLSEGKE
ncbi:MAG: hypothetical protein Kow0099_33290 [Candidatus Abyssubacteria bacterium]